MPNLCRHRPVGVGTKIDADERQLNGGQAGRYYKLLALLRPEKR